MTPSSSWRYKISTWQQVNICFLGVTMVTYQKLPKLQLNKSKSTEIINNNIWRVIRRQTPLLIGYCNKVKTLFVFQVSLLLFLLTSQTDHVLFDAHLSASIGRRERHELPPLSHLRSSMSGRTARPRHQVSYEEALNKWFWFWFWFCFGAWSQDRFKPRQSFNELLEMSWKLTENIQKVSNEVTTNQNQSQTANQNHTIAHHLFLGPKSKTEIISTESQKWQNNWQVQTLNWYVIFLEMLDF